MAQSNLQQQWPSYVHSKISDKDGNITEEWELVISQVLNNLTQILSPYGHVTPSLTTALATQVVASVPVGTMIWDTDLNALRVKDNTGNFVPV